MIKKEYDLEAQRRLVERAQHDPVVFGELFDVYYPQILGYMIRRTADVATAEDITSEVFMKALRGLHRFKWQGVPVSAWLYKIANNELRMYYRKKKHASLEEMEEAGGFEFPDDRDFVEELTAAQADLERHKLFVKAQVLLAQLPARYQEVLVLRFGEQKKIHEISQILGKREGTVKSLLSRGLRLLRSKMETSEKQPFSRASIIHSEDRNK